MITERLKQFIDSINISISAFEKSIGMSNASFRKIYNNNGSIGSDKLERILKTYPQLNPSWLLTGEGPMILGEETQPLSNNLNERILTFISHLGVNVAEFERNCNLSNGSVSKMGDNTRRSTLERISKIYPSLNLNWLLTGEGSMILGEENATQQNKFGKFIHVYIGRDAKDDKYVNGDHIVYIEKYSDHIRIITLKDSGFDVYKDYEEILRHLTSLSFSH